MPTVRRPRFGSLAYSPRKRAKKEIARVRAWAPNKDAKLLGFAGYKAGMIHLIVENNLPNSLTKGNSVSYPATIIECPPLKAASIRFYKHSRDGSRVVGDFFSTDLDKEIQKILPKSQKKKIEDITDFDDITVTVYTQPKLTGFTKKKPELFEMAIGGKKDEKLEYAKSILGKEIKVEDTFQEGAILDIHAITKGKGLQGPIKRFGIGRKRHKSEKGVRNPGSLGPWCGQGNIMWKVPHAGQTGYHLRTEYNKWILKIGQDPKDVNPKGGIGKYGVIKNSYIIVKGSVAGPKKRLIRFNQAMRPNKNTPKDAPTIQEMVV